MDITILRRLCAENKVLWRTHCLSRMQERDISRNDVFQVMENGEIIECYPDDYPNPSCLIMGKTDDDKTIHVVVGTDDKIIYFITAYEPDTRIFEDDLKTRREK